MASMMTPKRLSRAVSRETAGPDGIMTVQGISYESSYGYMITLDNERDGGHIGTGGGLRTLDWTYETGVRSIRGQSKPVREVSVSVTFASYDDADIFVDKCNTDVAVGSPGRIVTANGWYARAYITDMSFDTITPSCIICSATVVLLDGGTWYRDTANVLSKTNSASAYDYLDYPHGYDYDYLGTTVSDDITVESSSTDSVDIKIIIQGPAVNPYVIIDNNRYEIDDTIASGWNITIDTRAKTIIKTSDSGIVTNIFALGVRGDGAGSGTYIFERVKVGKHNVTWSSSGNIEITVYDERCIAPWSLV